MGNWDAADDLAGAVFLASWEYILEGLQVNGKWENGHKKWGNVFIKPDSEGKEKQ